MGARPAGPRHRRLPRDPARGPAHGDQHLRPPERRLADDRPPLRPGAADRDGTDDGSNGINRRAARSPQAALGKEHDRGLDFDQELFVGETGDADPGRAWRIVAELRPQRGADRLAFPYVALLDVESE